MRIAQTILAMVRARLRVAPRRQRVRERASVAGFASEMDRLLGKLQLARVVEHRQRHRETTGHERSQPGLVARQPRARFLQQVNLLLVEQSHLEARFAGAQTEYGAREESGNRCRPCDRHATEKRAPRADLVGAAQARVAEREQHLAALERLVVDEIQARQPLLVPPNRVVVREHPLRVIAGVAANLAARNACSGPACARW